MSKYDALWAWIRENGTDNFGFAEQRGCVRPDVTASFSKQRLPNDRQYLIEKEIVLV